MEVMTSAHSIFSTESTLGSLSNFRALSNFKTLATSFFVPTLWAPVYSETPLKVIPLIGALDNTDLEQSKLRYCLCCLQ